MSWGEQKASKGMAGGSEWKKGSPDDGIDSSYSFLTQSFPSFLFLSVTLHRVLFLSVFCSFVSFACLSP